MSAATASLEPKLGGSSRRYESAIAKPRPLHPLRLLQFLRRAMAGALLFATALATTRDAAAVPAVGATRPDVTIEDAWERTTTLSRFAGKPMLVVYEDRDSAQQNAALKHELAVLAAGDRYKNAIALVAVADVSGFDYWPIRGFVKSAIKDETHKQKTIIYCDWDGSVRKALSLDRGASNVVLYARDGRVIFASSGALSRERQRELIGMLRRQVED